MKMRRIGLYGLLGGGILAAVAACATLEKDECAVVNWYDLGVKDGQDGQRVTRADTYRNDCAKFGIPIDAQSFRAGWDVGIRQYCTPDVGFDQGIRGQRYRRSCPAGLAGAFEPPYELGRLIHDLNESNKDLAARIEVLSDDLAVEDLPPETRKLLRRERRGLRRDLRRDEDALDRAVRDARRQGFDVRY